MAASRWTFTTEQLMNTPSRKNGIDADKELSYRQQAANLIQDMGQRLQVEQLCINTAIVYMHRFYMFRSFTRFPRNEMAPACLFLAAKVEEQPRKLEHVIKVAHACLNRDLNRPPPNPKTEAYLEQAQQLVINENILLQTLGFEVTVDHPHTHVVKASTIILAKASKDLSKASYYLATNSLHMTTFCLQYRPTVVACVCIYLACKWANYKIPRSNEGREWFQYVDQRVTLELIENLYKEFLNILNKSPMKLRRKIMGWKGSGAEGSREDERMDPSRPSTSSHGKHSHERSAIHDQYDAPDFSKLGGHPDQKHFTDPRDRELEHRKDHPERRPGEHKLSHSSHHSDKKVPSSHQQDPKYMKKEDRHETHSHSQPHRSDVPHSLDLHKHEYRKDSPQVKSEYNVNGRPHLSSSQSAPSKSHYDAIKHGESKDSPGSVKQEHLPQSNALAATLVKSQSNTPTLQDDFKPKPKNAIDYSEYLKRKEQEKREREKIEREKFEREKLEREKHEKEKLEREKHLREKIEKEKERIQKQKAAAEAEKLNRTFTEGSYRENKHRPPKLDVSLPLPAENHIDQKPGVGNKENSERSSERPYHVNIKSPIKPHHNITVKSPIKSSDLKQPKLELAKVKISPEKNGSDPFSVNVNTDPVIRKLMVTNKDNGSSNATNLVDQVIANHEKVKQEPVDKFKQEPADKITESMDKIKQEPVDKIKPEINKIKKESVDKKIKDEPAVVKIKQEKVEAKDTAYQEPSETEPENDVKDIKMKIEQLEEGELEPGEIVETEPEITLKPEHSMAPDFKIKELGYDPSRGLDAAKASASGKSTPILTHIRSETNSDPNTPIRLKIPSQGQSGENSPLKIKISTKGLSADSDHSSGKHSSPHRHKHKHKEKHKHKHSRDKERHKEKYREKHGSSSTGTNGQSSSLKMSIKLSDIPGHSSSASNEIWAVKSKHDKHKHRASVSDTSLNKSNSVLEAERQQPWSMTDLITKSTSSVASSAASSPSRKRRRTPTVDQNSEQSSNSKAAKMGPNRIRRSSSSHSVVSMDLSDGDEGQMNGPPQMQANAQLSQIHGSLMQAIAQKKQEVELMRRKQEASIKRSQSARDLNPQIDRQQSGFDLESMMWAGSSSVDAPPLPLDHPPPPPPQQIKPPPPPPPH